MRAKIFIAVNNLFQSYDSGGSSVKTRQNKLFLWAIPLAAFLSGCPHPPTAPIPNTVTPTVTPVSTTPWIPTRTRTSTPTQGFSSTFSPPSTSSVVLTFTATRTSTPTQGSSPSLSPTGIFSALPTPTATPTGTAT